MAPDNDRMTEEDLAIATDAVERGVAEDESKVETTFRTSAGVLIRVLPVQEHLMHKVYDQIVVPDPPLVEMKQGSKTIMVENEDDPMYVRARRKAFAQMGEASLRITLLRGLEIIELAANMASYAEDTNWIEELEAMGIEPPPVNKGTARYIEWLRMRVFPSTSDMESLAKIQQRMSGLDAKEVEKIMDSFRSSN